MSSTLSTELNPRAADPTKLSYFSLPGEVRKIIMDYVLAPGDIYLWDPALETSTRSPDTSVNIKSRPGIQLIATCKQAYLEGHELFYSSNTFHLPPMTTFRWTDGLEAKHKAMIKHIAITFGLDESTPAMLHRAETSLEFPVPIPQKCGFLWGEAMMEPLIGLWKSKLRYIAAWTSLEDIELFSFGRTCILQHHDIVANSPSIFQHHDWRDHFYVWESTYWCDVLWESRCYAWINIAGKAERVGWEKTKEWLIVKKPVGMAKGSINRPHNAQKSGLVTWRQNP